MRNATTLILILFSTACDPAPQVAHRDITIPEAIPDRLACLDAWSCAASCVQPYLDGQDTYGLALECAEVCDRGTTRARGLFLSWVAYAHERCQTDSGDVDPACVLDQWHPPMGSGAYLSTCLNP